MKIKNLIKNHKKEKQAKCRMFSKFYIKGMVNPQILCTFVSSIHLSEEMEKCQFIEVAGYQRLDMERDSYLLSSSLHRNTQGGDPLYWFPMRVTYSRELSVKAGLDLLEIENFLPMRYAITGRDDERRRRLVPAINNLIFVRSTRSVLTQLKMTDRRFQPLRYMMQVEGNAPRQIIRVPDKQMEDFIRVASVRDDSVMFLDCDAYLRMPGLRVRIIEGPFAGVEGVVKRINRNRRVVVQVGDVAAVALAFVPPSALMVLE